MKNLLQLAFALLLVSSLVMLSPQNASATIYTIDVTMTGLQEVPSNTSPATGHLTGTYDDATNTIDFAVTYSGLQSNSSAAHFHGPAAPGMNASVQQGWTGMVFGTTSGTYSHTFVLSDAFEQQLLAGLWYANIHTTGRPGGEIRAQLDQGTLPVELTHFTSVINNNNVTLSWSTSVEINNAGFDVERRSAGTNEWTKINHVSGSGNSIQNQNYTVTDRGLVMGTYNYRLKQIDLNGNFEYFELNNEVVIGIPNQYNLSQNYPNPFNPSTKIDFEIPKDGFVSLKLYDVAGKEVATLVNDIRAAGYYSVNYSSSNISSGIYFYTLTSGNFVSTKKLNVIK